VGVAMEKPKAQATVLELFAALVEQLPLATREDLEWVVKSLKSRPEWQARLEKARIQAREVGLTLSEPQEPVSPPPSAPDSLPLPGFAWDQGHRLN
jgi:hypothetical protein